jgi:ubiquinone/menaquinone biosynthesis C-methylase UbiE
MLQRKRDEATDVIRHHWNARASAFDTELGHGVHSERQHEAWLRLLGRLAGHPPKRVLDAGCGTGVLALMFAELGHTVTGIDLAVRMLEVAKRKAERMNSRIEFRLENTAALSDPDGTYDLVVARHVIWTLPDPARGVAEWLRVLRPGGRLALIEGKWAYNDAAPRYSNPVKSAGAWLERAAWSFASFLAGRRLWKLYAREYRQLEARLPFSGGPPAERLTSFLEQQGVHDVTLEPLMDPVLWGEAPRFPRYLVVGRRAMPTS